MIARAPEGCLQFWRRFVRVWCLYRGSEPVQPRRLSAAEGRRQDRAEDTGNALLEIITRPWRCAGWLLLLPLLLNAVGGPRLSLDEYAAHVRQGLLDLPIEV